jgi:glutaredoxin
MFSKMTNYVLVDTLGGHLMLGIKEYSEWPTIPQLYLNGEFVGGCDIVMNMHQNGELENLLDEAGVLVPAEDVEQKAAEGEELVVGQDAAADVGLVHGDEPGGKPNDVKKGI